ncbi:unnamed protein product [Diabrotica balteata]|uniref:Uncharacterized protein n=1 Tax=Diabrotica balteata TaxID=107213 RepID=A0A9N9SWU3_DIABA|nr:unnamed protein product [Diabrotica balteata]
MCTVNRSHQRLLVSDGCPIPIGNSVCGETKTLDIINEFKRLYEEKMNEIDNTSCGDCLQEKLQLQQNWIGDLTEQNEMLVRAVEDLELEATERVKMLEEKLQRSAECICEAERRSTEKDSTIQKLEAKVGELNSMTKQFQMKKDECENLQKNMIDMRQALTEEVASKHDTVLKLKRECQELEERCIQADKQTAFRDDIIKELRKEIKQLRQQVSLPEKPYPKTADDTVLPSLTQSEHVLVINHTKKVIESGKSTVIYVHHDNEEKSKSSGKEKQIEVPIEQHTSNCSKCRVKFEHSNNELNKKIKNPNGLLSKSENDLNKGQNIEKPIKGRLKSTCANLNRWNTFVGTTSHSGESSNMDDFYKSPNVFVPNHTPVRMHVNNFESNKKK